MKKCYLLILIIASFTCLSQTTYYVSESGNTTNNGTSITTPWSFAKINSSMNVLQAGDNVLFKRGDTFRGKLFITTTAGILANKITFGAYGTGEKPIIKGSNVVSGPWTSAGSNIWYATYNQPVRHIYKNDQLMTIARYPNAGAQTVTTTGNTTSFTDNTLGQPTDYFKDATVHMRTIDWQWERRTVNSSSAAGLITYGPTASSYNMRTGWGYYFSNKLSFLDAANEWFYEASTSRLYVYSTTNPATDFFEIPAIDYGINLEWGRFNVVIQDFDVRQSTSIGIYFNKSEYSTITRCRVSQILDVGMLTFDGSNNNIISHNIVEDVLSTGISWDGVNETIIHNTVRRIGLVPGYGTTGYGDNAMNTGKFSYVAYNVAEDIANLGIGINQGSTGEYNFVNNPCVVMNDCGGMSVPFGQDGGINIMIRHNIVSNVRGGTFAAPANNPPIGKGIYYGGGDNVNVTTFNNTVINCNGPGIGMLDTKDSFALNNTTYNCNVGLSSNDHSLPTWIPNNNTITGNIFYGLKDTQTLFNFMNLQGTQMPNNMNISNNNQLHNPYSDRIFKTQIFTNPGYPTIEYTLERMQAERQHDLASTKSFLKLSGFKDVIATGSNLITNGNFDANISGWGMNENKFSISAWEASRAGMTGGSLKFANNTNQYTQPLRSFTIANNVASQWYRLKFSIIGNAPAIVIVDISNNGPTNWGGLTTAKYFAINTTVTNHEYFFQLPAGAINARAGFRIQNENAAVYTNWLDNVAIEAVTVTPDIAPEQRSPIFINPTTTTSNVSLLGKTYRNLDGSYVCGNSISIAPFASRILILEDEAPEVAINSIANLPTQNIANVNQCKWFHIDNAALRLASVNPQGNNLQTVSVQTYLNSTIRTVSGSKALGRNWVSNSTGTYGSAAKVRLYFTQAEFDALNAASPLINTVNDLVLTAYSGSTQDDIWCNNVGGTMTRIPATITAYQNGYYAEFDSSNNAEFWLSENFVIAPLSDTVPTFEAVAPACAGTTLAALPTTSTNNIVGSWSPALNNLATTTYTFTPTYGSCGVTATTIITIGSPTTWNGTSWSNGTPDASKSIVFNSNFTAAADVNACSVSVTGTAVVNIPSGFNVTVANEVNVANTASLTFENNANLYQVSTLGNINVGNIVFKRNSSPLVRLDYSLWSSPVANQNLLAFSPLTMPNRFYNYNSITRVFNTIASPSTTPFGVGNGFLIRKPNNHPTSPTVWNGAFTGVPNNGTFTIPLISSAVQLERYNLVGNPYPSPISMASLIAANPTTIAGSLYFWRKPNSFVGNGWSTWNGGTFVARGVLADVVNPNGIIQAGQGFMVEATAAGGSLVFNNNMRIINNNNQFFRPINNTTDNLPQMSRIWLNAIGSTGNSSQLAISYIDGGTTEVDGYDAKNFEDTGFALSSKINGTTNLYTIQSRPNPFIVSEVVPLHINATANEEISISIANKDGVFANNNQPIYIHDKLFNTFHNISVNAFSFPASIATYANRFDLVFTQSVLSNPIINRNSELAVFAEDNQISVNSLTSDMIKAVKIFDIKGSLLHENKAVVASTYNVNLYTEKQVLLVHITMHDDTISIKKLIF